MSESVPDTSAAAEAQQQAAAEEAGASGAADVPGQTAGEGSGGKQQDGTGLVVPLARVKKMMKETQDVKIIAADASWLVARATELLLQELAVRAHAVMAADSNRKALDYKDLAAVVEDWAMVDFLKVYIPPKVKFGDVREQLQQQADEFKPRCLNDD